MLDFEKESKASVLMKDRDKDIEMLRVALVMSGFGMSYHHADLLNTVLNRMNELEKGKFSLQDGTTIKAEWEEKWIKHHKENE